MEFLIIVVLLVIVVATVVWLFIARQGDAEFEFIVGERTAFVLDERTEQQRPSHAQYRLLIKVRKVGQLWMRILGIYCHMSSMMVLRSVRNGA